MPILRKRKFTGEVTSTPRVQPKKLKKKTLTQVQVSPVKQLIDSLDKSLLFEDAIASPSLAVEEQRNPILNVQESPVPLIAQGRSPDSEQLSDALQLRTSSLEQQQLKIIEQQHSAFDIAHPQLAHVSQVPRRSPFAFRAPTLALTQNSPGNRQNDAILNVTESVVENSAIATC